jgi:protein-tyrosine-phosphatase
MRQRGRAGARQPVVCVFVCKSNSARSIAAECIAAATARHAENYRFYSAGTARADGIKEPVQRALCRAGYSLDGLRSKSIQVGVKGIV